jgi:hypothetical protein
MHRHAACPQLQSTALAPVLGQAVDNFGKTASCRAEHHLRKKPLFVQDFFATLRALSEPCPRLTRGEGPDRKKMPRFCRFLHRFAPVIHKDLTAMKLKADQLDRLAELLFANYWDKGLIVTKSSDAEIKKKIVAVIANNFAEEEAIEIEARQLLAAHGPSSTRELDSYKMFVLAKQKLAAKKGFIL